MTRLHILSDLHLESGRWPRAVDVNAINADVTVLAGDIGIGLQGLDWALKIQRPVVYVMGNHEFYGQRTMASLWRQARRKVAGTHITLLENELTEILGVRFLGATLWTDFNLFGVARRADALAQSRQLINDYRAIFVSRRGRQQHGSDGFAVRSGNLLTPQLSTELHAASLQFLSLALSECAEVETGPIVAVTHHAPSQQSLAPRDLPPPWYAAYASHLDALVARTDLWIHGHAHRASDYRIGRARVVCNPRGHVDCEVVPGFDPVLVVEL